MTPPKTFLLKAMWRSTALYIKVKAKDEDEALLKAARRRDCKGAMEIILLGEATIYKGYYDK